MTIFKFPSNCCANFWVVLALCVNLQEGQVMYFDVNKTAKLVKKLREDAGLKQEEVASDMGINIKTYQIEGAKIITNINGKEYEYAPPLEEANLTRVVSDDFTIRLSDRV